ncbi:hypothetical protein FJY63_02655 [Candidatus Sumerlaeota bacterium]|nr:hypothetical protein [Candidatus Sumerlaeota bacterium]
MSRCIWTEKLDYFKGLERPEAVLLIAGSSQLVRIAVAWRDTRISKARRLTKSPRKSDEAVWRWLWESVRYSRKDLLARIPLSDSRTPRDFDALVANRVLYPDGTLNSFVERYLRERVLTIFKARSKNHRPRVPARRQTNRA